MMHKKIIVFLLLLTSWVIKPNCFDAQAGENQWRMIYSIGVCLNELESLTENVDSDLLSIGDVLESKLDEISSDIDCLTGVPITTADIPFTITQPGLYRLCENISTSTPTSITISASNVTLDFNGYGLGNTSLVGNIITIAAGNNNICIKNGFMTVANDGIVINGVTDANCLIQDLIIKNGGRAIFINNSNSVTVSDCLFQNQTTAGITINGSSSVVVQSCDFEKVANGISLTLSNSLLFKDCHFRKGTNGVAGSGISKVKFENCEVFGASGFAYSFTAITDLLEMVDCYGFSNSTPFSLTGAAPTSGISAIILRNCTSDNNGGAGFGFLSLGSGVTYALENCVAFNCGIGFLTQTDAVYVNCTTNNNGTGFGFVANTAGVAEYSNCIAMDVANGFWFEEPNCVARNCVAINTDPTVGIIGFRSLNDFQTIHDCSATGFANGFQLEFSNNVYSHCIANNCGEAFTILGAGNTLESCIAQTSTGDGFNISSTNATLKNCTATNNGNIGFDIQSTGAVIKDSLACQNVSSGIDDNGNAAFILDTRSFNNGAADVTGASTVITY